MNNEDLGKGSGVTSSTVEKKKAPVILQVLNIKTQEVEDHVLTINGNEFILTAKDGTFVKFSTDLSKDELYEAIDAYNKNPDNRNQVLEDADEVEAEKEARLDEFRGE
jgi:hypothetical protein